MFCFTCLKRQPRANLHSLYLHLIVNKYSANKGSAYNPTNHTDNDDGISMTESSSNSTFSHNDTEESSKFPEEPTTCCMSGCANCVWLEYAEKLSAYYKDGGEAAMAEIEKRVQDPNMKAFLLSELRLQMKYKGK